MIYLNLNNFDLNFRYKSDVIVKRENKNKNKIRLREEQT